MLAAAPRIRTYKQVCRVFFVIDKKKTQFTADLTKLEGVKGSHSASKVTAFRKVVNLIDHFLFCVAEVFKGYILVI
jgi:hypothetical protein